MFEFELVIKWHWIGRISRGSIQGDNYEKIQAIQNEVLKSVNSRISWNISQFFGVKYSFSDVHKKEGKLEFVVVYEQIEC